MNVLLVGHGYWGKKIAKTLAQFQDLQLFIYDKAESKISLESFLAQTPKFNHVFIVTPEQTHFELAKKFLLLGKNVFVEKPLCLEKEQAQELVALAIKKQIILFVDYIFLYDEFAKKIKEIIASKVLGKIEKINSKRSSSFVNKPNLLVTDDLMIHDLYLLRYFFANRIENLSFASSLNSGLKKTDLKLLMSDKLKIEVSYNWFSQKSSREMLIMGKNGTLSWNKNETFEELVFQVDKKNRTILVKNEKSPLFKSIEDFFNQIPGSNQRYNDYIDDVGLLSIARTNFYENQSL